MVTVCHKAEDVFDVLREGQRKVTAELMDVILEVIDLVNVMFDQIKSGNDPEQADDSLLARLQSYTRAGANEQTDDIATEVSSGPEVVEASVTSDVVEQEFEAMLGVDETVDNESSAADEISEQEFDNLLDELHGKGSFSAKKMLSSEEEQQVNETELNSGDISEEEFESLLDSLHGKGQFSANNLQEEPSKPQSTSDEITEEEFDSLLDDLHGKGKFKGAVSSNEIEQKKSSVDQGKESVENEQPIAKAEISQKKPEPEPESSPTAPAPAPAPAPALKVVTAKEKVSPVKKPSAPAQGETTVRVDTQILDDMMNMVGELVLVRNRFQTLKATMENGSGEQLFKAVSNLDVVTADLQLAVMKTRMQPIKKVFGRFPRVVRDLSRSLKKEIKLEMVGEDTDLDKNLVEALADPLVHLIRNAVDHGIETPDDRVAAGKPREGVVVLTASQEGDHIMLSIKDDGKGMNADVLRRIVVEKGLMDDETAARLEDKECYNLIFMPGFSTKTEISDVSGRGVGMDVVKTRITQMNGVVEIDSVEGVGSTIIIKVPLTLAIMPTLMVVLGGQAFALPLASVLEILDLDLSSTNTVDGQLVIMVREKALPIFFLSDWLVNDPNYQVDKKATSHIVIVNAGGKQIGFVVDQLIGQEEVVIKPLGAKLQGLDGLAGATITGDGKIALILDVPGLMSRYAG